jgi:hypothetical protein
MKKTWIIAALAFIATTQFSCTKDDNSSDNPGNTSGSWRISYYWDEKDETSDFAGYTFEFLTGGVAKATKGGTVVNGTWSESSSEFVINFGTDPVLSEINDDWDKTERTDSSIKLKDDNPVQDDQLHFVRL